MADGAHEKSNEGVYDGDGGVNLRETLELMFSAFSTITGRREKMSLMQSTQGFSTCPCAKHIESSFFLLVLLLVRVFLGSPGTNAICCC